MYYDIDARVLKEAEYIVKHKATVRSTAKVFGVSKSTVHHDVTAKLKYIDEYSDTNTERGRLLRREICRRLKLTSLEFQSLEGTIKAIGLDGSKLCTYCWNGKE